MEKNQSKHLVGSIICAVLTVLGLVSNALLLLQDFSDCILDIVRIADIIIVLLSVFYTVIGYKKPHGNLLKFVLLFFALSMMTRILHDMSHGVPLLVVLNMFAMTFIVYMAGRLDRVEQNKYLCIAILVLLIVVRIMLELYYVIPYGFDLILCIGHSTPLIVWLDLCVAYFLRYKEHREAGLMDAPKK